MWNYFWSPSNILRFQKKKKLLQKLHFLFEFQSILKGGGAPRGLTIYSNVSVNTK